MIEEQSNQRSILILQHQRRVVAQGDNVSVRRDSNQDPKTEKERPLLYKTPP